MIAIEEAASNKGWHNLWLECDSQLVVAAFHSNKGVHWKHQNRWNNYMAIANCMNFVVTHIYKEGNTCVDRLASHDLSKHGFLW